MVQRNKGKRLAKYIGDYVVFDLETTGVSVYKDDIIAILKDLVNIFDKIDV